MFVKKCKIFYWLSASGSNLLLIGQPQSGSKEKVKYLLNNGLWFRIFFFNFFKFILIKFVSIFPQIHWDKNILK